MESGQIEAPTKLWRNPFAIAFVLGALTLTVLPFLQRFSLRAPPPLTTLGAWSLSSVGANDGAGEGFGAEDLRGKAWLASFVRAPCDADCEKDLQHFGRAATHIEDFGDKVAMVTFAQADAVDVAQKLHSGGANTWRLVTGNADALDPVWARFAQAWQTQTEKLTERTIVFLARPTYAVVDQNGAVRGFWPADDEGRGHAINAVRMFARHGPTP